MFSGEIGSLQSRTSYAVARTIGSRETAQHSPACRIHTVLRWLSGAARRATRDGRRARRAFMATVADKEFLAAAERSKLEIT
jgi:hypothetical protein